MFFRRKSIDAEIAGLERRREALDRQLQNLEAKLFTDHADTPHARRDSLVDGTVLEFETYARFTDQRHVRNAIGAATNRYVPKIKPKVWEGIVQVILDALTETAGGDENDLKASTRLCVDRYLRDVGFIDAPEKQPVHAQRKPALIDGCIAVSATDLHAYLNKTNAQPVSVKAVTSRLAALGAENIRPRSGPFRDQSRWVLPTENFAPADYCNWLLEGGTDARA